MRVLPWPSLWKQRAWRSGLGKGDSSSGPSGLLAGHASSDNTIFAAAGKLEFARLVEAVEAACGDWPSGSSRPLPGAPIYVPRTMELQRDSNQQHIGIGVQGVPVGHADYYATALLSTILGGSMNSRLFTEVREKRGLAYGVGAYPMSLRDAGMIRIYAGTVPQKAHETVAVTLAELRKLEEGGVRQDELDRAKTVLKSRVIMAGENTRVRRSAIGSLSGTRVGCGLWMRFARS